MAKIYSKADFDLLLRLASLNNALTLNVTEPVVVDEPGCPRMFYDCTEEEGRGLRVVQERILRAMTDIDRHTVLHTDMLAHFKGIERGLAGNSRNLIAHLVECLRDNLSSYADLVDTHTTREKSGAFLSYPRANPTSMFTVPLIHADGSGNFAYLKFNSQGNRLAFDGELIALMSSCREFSNGRDRLPKIELGNPDSGSGITDTSYRGRLALTTELLHRAGYTR